LIPSLLIDRKYLAKLWQFNRDVTEDYRKAYDSGHYLTDSVALQELRITGGHKYLHNHFTGFINKWLQKLTSMRATWFKYIFGFRVLRSLAEAYADLYVFQKFISGVVSIGDVTFYIRQVSNFMSSLSSVGNSINNIYEGSLTIGETIELFESPEEVDGTEAFKKLTEGPTIKIENLSFSYPRSTKKVIKKLDLEIKKGEKIAIVGHNGAGKTTLIKLLLRFYKPQEGEIFINGGKLANLKINDYFRNVSVLFQDFNSYPHLSLKENISIGKPGKISLKNIKKAAKYADVSDFVEEYKDGYDQLLSEKYKAGTRPSTGQWQKIAIARFFYRNSPLVIFDEPTAAIDAKSEAKIFNKIYSFFRGKTVIIISHRFSTVRNADRIIVFSKGEIVEQGSHKELMELNGTYAEAFNIQALGYKS
jgi:ATP-binding cassette subfamily B protein